MFWVGLVMALVAGLLGIGLSREFARSKYPRLHDLHLDRAALVLLVIGLAIAAYEYREGQIAFNELETRPFFKPLDPEQHESIVLQLREVREKFKKQLRSVNIQADAGSATRRQLAQQITEVLNDAGFQSRVSVVNSTPANPPPPFRSIDISPNPQDLELARAIAAALGIFIVTEISITETPGRTKGVLVLSVNGDPLFSKDGNVTFR